MKETKFWFGLLIVFFIFVYAIVPAYLFGKIDLPHNVINYKQIERHSCHIMIEEPTILFRLDDVRGYSKPTPEIVNKFIKENISITLGVIPVGLDSELKRYLISIKSNPLIEIAQHGYKHNVSESDISVNNLIEGRLILQRDLGVLPITYIPPLNNISENAYYRLSSYFKVISGGQNNLKSGDIAEIGQTIGTYDYEKNYSFSNTEIVETCRQNLAKFNFCVVTLHPQEFKSQEDYVLLDDLLWQLNKLNTEYKTFAQATYCTDD
jgi:hypothetical protein